MEVNEGADGSACLVGASGAGAPREGMSNPPSAPPPRFHQFHLVELTPLLYF